MNAISARNRWLALAAGIAILAGGMWLGRETWKARRPDAGPVPSDAGNGALGQPAAPSTPSPAGGPSSLVPHQDIAASPAPERLDLSDLDAAALRDEAAGAARRLMESLPDAPDALGVTAMMHHRFGNSSEEERLWRRCAEIDPGFAESYLGLGGIALKQGRYEQAADLFRKAVRAAPRVAEAHMRLGEALMGLGRMREAARALENGMKTCPPTSESRYMLGQAYAQLKDFGRARREYEAAIALDSACTYAYYGLAQACLRLSQAEAADRYRLQFEKLKRQDQEAEKKKLKAFDDRARVRQSAALIITAAGQVYARHGNPRAAEASWEKARAMDPESADCRRELARRYQESARWPELLAVFGELARLEPQNPAWLLNLGITHARLGGFEPAEDAFREAVKRAPKRPEGYVALAQLYLRMDRKLAEARRMAAVAVELAPSPQHYQVLGAACQRAGDRDGALRAIDSAIGLDPDHADRYQRQKREIQGQP